MSICPECGAEFAPNSHNQRFCCPPCGKRFGNRKRWEREQARLRSAAVRTWAPEWDGDPFDNIDRCTGLPMGHAQYAPMG